MANHTDRTHADFAPSASERWLNCGASVNLIRKLMRQGKLVEGPAGHAASLGTAAHELLERCLRNGKSARTYAHRKFNGMILDLSILAAVDKARAYILAAAEGERVDCEEEVFIPATQDVGHLDAAALVGDTLHIFDYKNGRHRVSPKRNTQMMLYALGKLRGMRKQGMNLPGKVRLHIIQPNARARVGTYWDTTLADLMAWSVTVSEKVRAIKAKRATYAIGDKQCFWCPAKPWCPAHDKAANDAARKDWL